MARSSTVIILVCVLTCIQGSTVPLGAQSIFHRVDSFLNRQYNKGNIDTAYIVRPAKKWTFVARMNVSGTRIEAKGIENGLHFRSEMEANSKATLSVGVCYLGLSLSAAVNPAKLMGKYHDFELNFIFAGI